VFRLVFYKILQTKLLLSNENKIEFESQLIPLAKIPMYHYDKNLRLIFSLAKLKNKYIICPRI